MKDSSVLGAVMADRGAYDKIRKYVDTSEFSPLAAHWWPLIAAWYERDPKAEAVDRDQLRERGKRETEEKHADTALGFYDDIPTDVSPENIVFDLLEIKRHAKGHELAAAVTGGVAPDKLSKLVSGYEELLRSNALGSSDTKYAAEWDSVCDAKREGQVSLIPKALNDKCDGGPIAGDFIILFARPEMGKTLFCVSLVSHWLRLGKKVLYIGNEDPIDKIKGRIGQNLANMTKQEMDKYGDEALRRIKAKSGDRLIAVHLHPGTVPEIEELVREHRPDILVVDQLRNVGGEGDLKSRLNQASIDIRQLLSKYDMIGLAIAQANAGEHGKTKMWLESSDVDESRTGIPAQADLLLGMSADNAMLQHGNRAIALCKNKLGGDHEGIIISVDTMRNKIS